eukprot:scaffold237639_cov38-Prasinocladus_malaysianus.AAC.1
MPSAHAASLEVTCVVLCLVLYAKLDGGKIARAPNIKKGNGTVRYSFATIEVVRQPTYQGTGTSTSVVSNSLKYEYAYQCLYEYSYQVLYPCPVVLGLARTGTRYGARPKQHQNVTVPYRLRLYEVVRTGGKEVPHFLWRQSS